MPGFSIVSRADLRDLRETPERIARETGSNNPQRDVAEGRTTDRADGFALVDHFTAANAKCGHRRKRADDDVDDAAGRESGAPENDKPARRFTEIHW